MKVLQVPVSRIVAWYYRLDTQAYFWEEAQSDTGRRLKAARSHLRRALAGYRNRKREHMEAVKQRMAPESKIVRLV